MAVAMCAASDIALAETVNTPFSNQTGRFVAKFRATPSNSQGDVVIGLSDGFATAYTDIAAAVRFSNRGVIDARNGSSYGASTTIRYSAGTSYAFRMEVDIPSKSYSVYVTPLGEAEVLLGRGFGFRTEQSRVMALNNRALISSMGTASLSPVELITSSSVGDPLLNSDPLRWASVGSTSQVIGGVTCSVHGAFKDYSIRRSPSGGIYRFELRQGDRRSSDSSSVDRVELKHGLNFKPGVELWTAYSFMIEKGQAFDNEWQNLGQWHAGTGSPAVAIHFPYDNIMRIMTRSGSSSNAITAKHYVMNDFQRGSWYNIVQRLRVDARGSGVLQVWANGKMILDLRNVSIGYTDSTYNYWKWGIYRDSSPLTTVAYYANMEVSTSSLYGRVSSPRPVVP